MPLTGTRSATGVSSIPGIGESAATAAVRLRTMMEERSLRGETFTYHHEGKTYRWDVSAAWRLLLANPRQPTRFVPAEQGVDIHHLMDRYPDLNVGYALTCDLTLPLLFVPFAGRHQLIDGWHRLARSLIEEDTLGSAEMPAFILTEEEADTVLLFVRDGDRAEKGSHP
jgi:hypothetical protein